jgi:nucleoside 2-deoxyribosyltransferase
MTDAPRIYLAGPDVFWPDARERGDRLKELCASRGMVGVFPLDSGIKLTGLDPIEQGFAIFQANIELIRSCNAILANMSPFRGPSMDVGTAFEMGFGRALKLLVAGYTSHLSAYKARAAADGLLVEDFDMVDNLMVHGVTGGSIFPAPEQALDYLRSLL